jgi:hypothetical protein
MSDDAPPAEEPVSSPSDQPSTPVDPVASDSASAGPPEAAPDPPPAQNSARDSTPEDIPDGSAHTSETQPNTDEPDGQRQSDAPGPAEEEERPSEATASGSDRISPIPIKKKAPPKRAPDLPPAEEIEAALDLLLHGVPPEDFDPVTLRCCMDELAKLKKEAVAHKNYLDADRYAQLIKQSQKACDVSTFSALCTGQLGYFMDKQADAQEKVDEANGQWDETFQQFEEMVNAKMAELTDNQNSELDAFDASRPDDLPVKYVKHSVEYVALRKRERLLIRNEDYVTADAVKQKADALEAEELTSQHLKLQDDLQRQRNAIIEKHSQQFDAFAIWLNSKRRDMIRARMKDLEGPLRRLDHYTRLVERIEKKGLPPNPYHGFTTNRVSRKESIKAVRTAAQTPMDRDPAKAKPREKPVIPGFRPTSAMRIVGSG